MASTSPNMNLTIPTVGVELGPQWAIDLNASLSVIDLHDHSTGKGVQITPAGIDITEDLSFNFFQNAINVRTIQFTSQSAPLSPVAPDIGCVYVSGYELYYNDRNGHTVQITTNGSVNAGAGSITGLPSGTASASFSAISGTFVWQQATNTAANMDSATLIVRYPGSYPTPAGNYIALAAPTSLASGYFLYLPGLPAQTNVMTLSNGGVMSSITYDQVGQAMSSVGANAIGSAMNSTGANTIASTMSVAGTDAIATTMDTTGANTIVGKATNFPASPLFGGDSPVVWQAGNFGSSVKMLFGYVSDTGAPITFGGYTCTRPFTGVYNITPTSAFTNFVIVVTPVTPLNQYVATVQQGGGGLPTTTVNITDLSGTYVNVRFSFLIIGN